MAKRAAVKKYVIRDSNGTYFRRMVLIGPLFGGTITEACRFDTKEDAARQLGVHFAFGSSKVETVIDKA